MNEKISPSNPPQPNPPVSCADIEVVLADYLDRTLPTGQHAAVEQHLQQCAGCREFAADIAGAMTLMERSAEVEAPPELVNKLLFEVTNGSSRAVVKPSWPVRVLGKLFGRWLEPVLQPRFAMGMAMTVLSLGMLLRLDSVRQMRPSQLSPVELWLTAEDKVNGWWDDAVKYYDSLRVVFEIEAMYREWADQQTVAGEPGGAQQDPQQVDEPAAGGVPAASGEEVPE